MLSSSFSSSLQVRPAGILVPAPLIPRVCCSTPGCNRDALDGQTCSPDCQGVRCCVPSCNNPAKWGRVGWKCSLSCGADTFVREVISGTDKYDDLVGQLMCKWPRAPEVGRIYSVSNWNGPVERHHRDYCAALGNIGAHGSGRDPGNQQRRFHATVLTCDFRGAPCSDPNCRACCIIRMGFDINRVANNCWFGQGIYSSSCPDEAYKFGNKRAMFVVNVACGRVEKSRVKTLPQAGCHSRSAEKPGVDELVVFNNRAMVPRYLIVWA